MGISSHWILFMFPDAAASGAAAQRVQEERAFLKARPNNEMQLTRSACERTGRPLQLISVLGGSGSDLLSTTGRMR
jgi:hypothetical protein